MRKVFRNNVLFFCILTNLYLRQCVGVKEKKFFIAYLFFLMKMRLGKEVKKRERGKQGYFMKRKMGRRTNK